MKNKIPVRAMWGSHEDKRDFETGEVRRTYATSLDNSIAA